MTKLSAYLNGLTEDTTPDTANDMLLEYDASASGCKKLKLSTVITGLSTGLGADGWATADAMTYASADAPTFTMTCSGDQTAKYYPGMRVKLTQTTVKYFIITAVAYSSNTTITLYGGTDYTLANAGITSPYYSSAKAPAGFPLNPTKWQVATISDNTIVTKASPVSGTWYNDWGNISVPIGAWRLYYNVIFQANRVSTPGNIEAFVTLSTTNNGDSDNEFRGFITGNSVLGVGSTIHREKAIVLASKTVYYCNYSAAVAGLAALYIRNDYGIGRLVAVCAYL